MGKRKSPSHASTRQHNIVHITDGPSESTELVCYSDRLVLRDPSASEESLWSLDLPENCSAFLSCAAAGDGRVFALVDGDKILVLDQQQDKTLKQLEFSANKLITYRELPTVLFLVDQDCTVVGVDSSDFAVLAKSKPVDQGSAVFSADFQSPVFAYASRKEKELGILSFDFDRESKQFVESQWQSIPFEANLKSFALDLDHKRVALLDDQGHASVFDLTCDPVTRSRVDLEGELSCVSLIAFFQSYVLMSGIHGSSLTLRVCCPLSGVLIESRDLALSEESGATKKPKGCAPVVLSIRQSGGDSVRIFSTKGVFEAPLSLPELSLASVLGKKASEDQLQYSYSQVFERHDEIERTMSSLTLDDVEKLLECPSSISEPFLIRVALKCAKEMGSGNVVRWQEALSSCLSSPISVHLSGSPLSALEDQELLVILLLFRFLPHKLLLNQCVSILKSYFDSASTMPAPTGVVSWLSALVDCNFARMILMPECSSLVELIHEWSADHFECTQKLVLLRSSVQKLCQAESLSSKRSKRKPPYSVEMLHL